jgi:hypothetical protein
VIGFLRSSIDRVAPEFIDLEDNSSLDSNRLRRLFVMATTSRTKYMYSVPLLESRPRFLGNVALNLKFNLGHLQCLSTKHAIKPCDLSKALATAGTVVVLRAELELRLMLVHDICRSTQLRFQLRRE